MAIRWFDGFKNFNQAEILSRLAVDSSGNLTLDGNPISTGSTSGTNGILTYDTLTDLQNAYPNGTNVPVWVIADNCWYYWSGTVADTTPPVITISPSAGTYGVSKTVTLSADETTTIYYTLDGSTPTTSSSVYSTPLTISSTTTVKYFGKDTAGNNSVVQSASFTIDTIAPNNITNLSVGTVTTTSIPLTWTLSSSSDVANYEVAYSSNGGTNYTVASSSVNSSSTSYTISGLSSSTNYTIRIVAIDNVGNRSTGVTTTANTATPSDTTPPNDVTNLIASNVTSSSLTLSWTASNSSDIASYDVYQGSNLLGNTTNTTYNVNSLSASTQYTFKVVSKDTSGNASTGVSVNATTSAPADTTPPTITASPVGGTYTSSQSVALTSNETSTIYYTTDGTTPTTSSSVYSSPISVSANTTLKYFGKDTAGNSSAVQTQTYTVNITPSKTGSETLTTNSLLVYLDGTDLTTVTGTGVQNGIVTWADKSGSGSGDSMKLYPNGASIIAPSTWDATNGFTFNSNIASFGESGGVWNGNSGMVLQPFTNFINPFPGTFEFIVKLSSAGSTHLIRIDNGSSTHTIDMMSYKTGEIAVIHTTSLGQTSTMYPDYTMNSGLVGNYIHLVYTFNADKKTASIYVNGQLGNSKTDTNGYYDFTTATNAYAYYNNTATDSSVKAIRYYGRELSASEILNNYYAFENLGKIS